MNAVIRNCIGIHRSGDIQSYKNIGMVPLFSPEISEFEYLIYEEALHNKSITITEVFQEGQIPELHVINSSGSMLLLIDGEELPGAGHKLITDTSILIAGSSTLVLPVSCIECSRWSYRSTTARGRQRHSAFSVRTVNMREINDCSEQQEHCRSIQTAHRNTNGLKPEKYSATEFRHDMYEGGQAFCSGLLAAFYTRTRADRRGFSCQRQYCGT